MFLLLDLKTVSSVCLLHTEHVYRDSLVVVVRYGHFALGITEILYNWATECHDLPIIQTTMEHIRNQLSSWFDTRRDSRLRWNSILVPSASQKPSRMWIVTKFCVRMRSSLRLFQQREQTLWISEHGYVPATVGSFTVYLVLMQQQLSSHANRTPVNSLSHASRLEAISRHIH